MVYSCHGSLYLPLVLWYFRVARHRRLHEPEVLARSSSDEEEEEEAVEVRHRRIEDMEESSEEEELSEDVSISLLISP